MIRALRLLSIIAVVSFFAIKFYHTQPNAAHHTPGFNKVFSEAASEGSKEDPEGRDRWEWMRLHDPATGKIPDNIRAKELAFAATLPARPQSSSFFKTLNGATTQSYNWQPRGPYNVGGRTRALGVDVRNENIILAGGITGGMWRSTNAGVSWVRTTPLDQLPSVTCLVQDTRTGHQDTWYYGTGEYRTNVRRFGNADYYGNGIYKSTDNGVTWNQLASTVSNNPQQLADIFQYVTNIVPDLSNTSQDVLYAATYGAIMRSTDGGNSWLAVLGGGAGDTVGFTNVAINYGVVVAGIGSGGVTHGIWISGDGTQWTNITPKALWSDSTRGVTLDISPYDPTTLYVLAETPNKGLQVPSSYTNYEWYSLWKYHYETTDSSGGTWTDLSQNLPHFPGHNYETYNGLASYAMIVKVSPFEPNSVLLGGTDMYLSTDGFSDTAHTVWLGGYDQNGNYGSTPSELHPDQHVLVFSRAHPGKIFVGNDGGLFSLPLASFAQDTVWTPLDNGYVTGQFYTTALDHQRKGNVTVLGGLQDNGTWGSDSTNPNTIWNGIDGGDGSFCAIGDSGKSIYVSSQYGVTYSVIIRGNIPDTNLVAYDQTQNPLTLFVDPFTLDPASNNVMYMPFGDTLFRNSTVNGHNPFTQWQGINHTVDGSAITAIGVSTANPTHRLYYGTSNGKLFFINGANQGNPAKTEITGTNFPHGGYINCVAVDPFDGNRVMVVFSNYNVQSLFYTSDAGLTWRAVGGNLEQHPDGTGDGPSCRWATILHRGNDTLYLVGTTVGLFSTTTLDNFSEAGPNITWTQEGTTSIGNNIVDMVDARQSDGYVTVATWGNGMFSATIPTINTEAVYEPANSSPQNIQLYQNYPNPFGGASGSAATTIRFTIPSSQNNGETSLVLYDEQGREMQVLASGNFSAGEHSVTLDAGDLPNGTYYYKLRSGRFTQTKALHIVR